MKLLSDEERLKLIADLEETKWELTRKLNSLPITQRTEASKKRKKDVEDQLISIEEAIEKFKTKKTIYIEVGDDYP